MNVYKVISTMLVLALITLGCGGWDFIEKHILIPNQAPTPTYEPYLTETPSDDQTPAEEATSTQELTATEEISEGVPGKWTGEARWLCDENPVWNISMDFKRNGSVIITSYNAALGTFSSSAVWELYGDDIRIDAEYGSWTGIVEDTSMAGEFSDEKCSGIWAVSK